MKDIGITKCKLLSLLFLISIENYSFPKYSEQNSVFIGYYMLVRFPYMKVLKQLFWCTIYCALTRQKRISFQTIQRDFYSTIPCLQQRLQSKIYCSHGISTVILLRLQKSVLEISTYVLDLFQKNTFFYDDLS